MQDELRKTYGYFRGREQLTREEHEATITSLQADALHWELTAQQRTEQALEISADRDRANAQNALLQAELLRLRTHVAQLQNALGEFKAAANATTPPRPPGAASGAIAPIRTRLAAQSQPAGASLNRADVSRLLLRVANEAFRFAKEGGEQFFLADLPGKDAACDELLRLTAPAAAPKGAGVPSVRGRTLDAMHIRGSLKKQSPISNEE